jgi:hypothetical protein
VGVEITWVSEMSVMESRMNTVLCPGRNRSREGVSRDFI